MASTSLLFQEHHQPDIPSKVKVTILASEWGSSKGGLSTLNRELAIQLAKLPEVEITFFLPRCSEGEKNQALSQNVKVVEAVPHPGFEELDWLSFPPDDLQIDVVVGHGIKLGHQAQVIRKFKNCQWVQMVHTDPEELGMFKTYDKPISKGEEKHKTEVKLCEMADLVVGVGPKLSEAFRSYLRGFQEVRCVHDFTPGVFDEFVSAKQSHDEQKHRSVLVFGRGDDEDFELKGFDIAGRAISKLPDTRLVFAGAPDGKHEEVARKLSECGVPKRCLRVRGFVQSREELKRLFQEVDLVLMPSRTEGFGLTGLEALSAGLPVFVSRNSGFGEALCKVPFGSSFVIDSEDPEEWAAAIKEVWNKDRQGRLDEAETLRTSYGKKYNWAKQSRGLLDKMISIVHGTSDAKTDLQQLVADTECVVEENVKSLKLDHCQAEQGVIPLVAGLQRSQSASQISREFAYCEADITFFASRHDEDTRQWLFKDFDKWFSDPGDSRAYVLLGDAGIGKSVIAGALTQRARNKGHLGAAYFCRHNDGTRNNPRYLVGTIARQLCDCNSEISILVGGEDGVKMMLADSKLGVKELFTKLLEEPLGKCAPCQQRKLVIIDALDETEYESREDFLYVIKKALPRLPQWLLFFITSRPEDSVQSRLEKYKPCIRICAGDSEERGFYKQHEQDIKLFLEKEIDFSYISYSIEQVTKKCNGLFLYAYYIAEVLKESNSHRVSQQTDLFPGDIDEFFEENFQRVFDKVGADLYRKLFGCIIAAPSPLPISFISFVLNREKSNLDEQEAIDAVSLFVIRTSDETLEFLHNLIPTWLTDKKKASRKLLIDTEVAVEYLRMIFIDVLSAVVQETPATLSCRDENLERFVMHFAVRFLCHPNNQNSLTDVFSWLTCYPFLEKRIQSGRIEIYHLIEDFQLASSCIAVDETQKQKILREISLALEIDFHVLVECPHLFRSCVRNASDAVQRQFSIPPVSAPRLEWSICEFLATHAVYKCTCFATASDKKTIAGVLDHSLFFFDASTLETLSGPFSVSQYVTKKIKHLEFSPDDKFVFFGRLDKWFSVGRGCVEDFPQFSGNTLHYDWGVVVPNGQHIVVKRSDHFSALPPTCEMRICIVDLLSLWATKEIDRNPDKEWNFTGYFLDALADFPLGIETKCVLEYLGVNVEFTRACALNVANDTSCYFCDKLKELRDPYKESSLVSVRQHIIDIYPWIFPYQVWNLVTGRPLLQDVFCQSNVLNPFLSFCHVAFALRWYVDISVIGVGQVVSVRNVAWVTALNAIPELWRKLRISFHQLGFERLERKRQLEHLVRYDCFFNYPDEIMPFWVSPLKRWTFYHSGTKECWIHGEIHLLQTGSQEQDSSNYSPEKRKHEIPGGKCLIFTYDDLYVVYLSFAGLLQALCLETGTVLTSVSGPNCFYFTREREFGFLFRRDTEERFVFLTNLCDPFEFFRQQISVPGKTVAACFSSSDTVTTVTSKSMIVSCRITIDKRGFFFNVMHSSSLANSSIQVLHIQYSPNGILVAFQQDTKIMECNIEESIKFPCVVYEGDFCSTDLYLTFSPDGSFLLFSIKDNFEGQFFYVWNVYTKTLSEKFTSPGLLTIDSFCLSSDNRNLILCGGECEIEIWEFSFYPLHLLKRICVERSFNPVKFSHCAVSQDTELLVCCLANVIFVHSLQVADIHFSKRVLHGHLGKIEFCKFLKRNRYLISYAVDGMVFLWDISESKALGFARIAKGREKILCMAVSPDEDRAVCFISPSRVCVLNFCNLKCALPADFFTAQRKSRIITAETSLLPVGQIPSTSNVQASRLEDDQHGGFRSPDLEEQFLLTPEDLLDSDESDDCVDYDDSD